MDHTKEHTELAVQIGKLMEKAEGLKRDNDLLRSAIAEKTAQVEMQEERIAKLQSRLDTSETIRHALNRLYLIEGDGKTEIRTHARIAELKKRIAELEAEVAAPILTSVNRLADHLADERKKVERLREALQRIMLHRFSRSIGWEQMSENMRVIAREALATTADTQRPTCAWTYDDSTSSWDSACGEKWQFTDGGPEENGVKFCHGCGRRVRA